MIHALITRLALTADQIPHADPSSNTVKTVLSFVFGLAGAIALLIIAIAGLRYTISRGDSNAVKNAKDAIIYAVIGLVITMAAYAIVQFVFKNVQR
jgi:type IV secretory pathway VirB2 component (pilin)